jgi:hypothetical protein
MVAWKVASTDVLTGQVLCDDLPLDIQSVSANLNGTGTLTGALDLNQAAAVNAPFLRALTCRRAILWALADGWPVWAGIQLDWPQMSMAQGTLSVSAQTVDAVYGKRLISDTIEYQAADLFTAFLDLAQYGLTKQSSYIATGGVSPPATRPAGYLALMASQGRLARVTLPSGITSGVPWTASYTYSDLTQVSSAWSDMCASGNLEYWFQPGFSAAGELEVSLRLGYTQLGRPLADSGIVLTYPGNALDYGWTVTGSQSSNYVWATAPPNGAELTWLSVYPYGADLADLATYPVFESTVSWQGSVVTEQSQVNAFAQGQVALTTSGMTTPTVNVGGSGYPRLADIQLGDSAMLAFTSPMHPAGQNGEPGLQQEVRITGWTWYPSGPSQSEYIQLATSAVTAS